MGIFDPGFKKLVDEAPPQFTDFAAIALNQADERIQRISLKGAATQDYFRTAVLAALVITANQKLGIWSMKASEAAKRRGDYALSQLRDDVIEEARDTVRFTWHTFGFLLISEKPLT